MLKKFKKFLKYGYLELSSFADTGIELIALYFIYAIYAICWFISRIFLFVTAPIWIIPYCIYKSRKENRIG